MILLASVLQMLQSLHQAASTDTYASAMIAHDTFGCSIKNLALQGLGILLL